MFVNALSFAAEVVGDNKVSSVQSLLLKELSKKLNQLRKETTLWLKIKLLASKNKRYKQRFRCSHDAIVRVTYGNIPRV